MTRGTGEQVANSLDTRGGGEQLEKPKAAKKKTAIKTVAKKKKR
jgi:hypothetical protein